MSRRFFNKVASQCRTIAAIFTGAVIGATGAAIYNYYNPSLAVSHAKNDSSFALNLARSIMSTNRQVKEAVAVESTQDATQFGKEYHHEL